VVYDRDLYHYDINSQRVCHTASLDEGGRGVCLASRDDDGLLSFLLLAYFGSSLRVLRQASRYIMYRN
jgi:hypothetical protein